ncbi:glycosyltransferase [Xiamenia xianingshaonis]|uniref:Glycosyltransferase n=1 Tax=Xiamenia xianingshaonis TaxID=2682776 RepID=A0A9E6MP37_9ACTN|nr:glycosyltransferase family 2 protein [Xiamenia xianingshaonis]NHM13843.1 glycosyltransferase [Xiamenia xianingshaonis]QTU83702.1 glycosyltransferase [Xiamenia xianingshaonis]
MAPKVSIVVPIYNVSDYVGECLDSILAQTLKEIEVICVNDGSTDNSLDIVKKYEGLDDRIVVIDKQNAGYGAAMNDGLRIARGEFVGIVEPDDYIDPCMYETMYEKAVSGELADIVKCAWREVGEDQDDVVRNPYLNLVPSDYLTVGMFPDILHWHPSTPMGIYRKAFLEEHAITYVEAPGAGWVDNPFFIEVFYYAKIIKICAEPFYNYRIGDFEHSSVLRDCNVPLDRLNDMMDFLDGVEENETFRFALAKRAFVYLRRILDSPYYFNQRDAVRERIVQTFSRISPTLVATGRFTLEEKELYQQFTNPPLRRFDYDPSGAAVSIVIPIYNVEQYLRECLNSVVTQSLKNIEIICVDDRSKDFSRCIANVFADKDERIQLVAQEVNGGYGKGMNTGLDHAHGEYIGIVEPDDYIAPTMFEELYTRTKLYDLDICKADFYRFKQDARKDVRFQYVTMPKSRDLYNKVITPLDEELFFRCTMNTVSGIYRISMLREWGIRWNETPGASFQDNGFYVCTSAVAKRFMFIDRPLYYNRRDNPNSSVADRGKVYCMNEEYAFIQDWLKKNNLWEKVKEEWASLLYRNEMFTYNRISDSFHEEYAAYISDDFNQLVQDEELTLSYFSDKERSVLKVLREDPQEFIRRQDGSDITKVEKLQAEVNKVRNSKSFKIGKAVTSGPRMVKKLVRGAKKKS